MLKLMAMLGVALAAAGAFGQVTPFSVCAHLGGGEEYRDHQRELQLMQAAGILGGSDIALGLPALVLTLGVNLGVAVQTTLIIIGLLGGVLVAQVTAFFVAVMPAQVGALPGPLPKQTDTSTTGQAPAPPAGTEVLKVTS